MIYQLSLSKKKEMKDSTWPLFHGSLFANICRRTGLMSMGYESKACGEQYHLLWTPLGCFLQSIATPTRLSGGGPVTTTHSHSGPGAKVCQQWLVMPPASLFFLRLEIRGQALLERTNLDAFPLYYNTPSTVVNASRSLYAVWFRSLGLIKLQCSMESTAFSFHLHGWQNVDAQQESDFFPHQHFQMHISIDLSIHLSIHLSIYLTCPSIHPSIHSSIHRLVKLSSKHSQLVLINLAF